MSTANDIAADRPQQALNLLERARDMLTRHPDGKQWVLAFHWSENHKEIYGA